MTHAIDPARLQGILDFLQAAEALKDTLRSARTSGGRRESTAEHSWRLCLLAVLLETAFDDLDLAKLLKLCLIHDLGEAISGDIPAIHQTGGDDRAARERADLITLCDPLPEDLRAEILAHWDEYAAARSPEAVIAKGLDKIETMLQHLAGQNGPDFDYAFNLSYGLAQTEAHPLLQQIRAVVDAETARRVERD